MGRQSPYILTQIFGIEQDGQNNHKIHRSATYSKSIKQCNYVKMKMSTVGLTVQGDSPAKE